VDHNNSPLIIAYPYSCRRISAGFILLVRLPRRYPVTQPTIRDRAMEVTASPRETLTGSLTLRVAASAFAIAGNGFRPQGTGMEMERNPMP